MWINHDDYIEAVEKNSGPLNRIAGFQETIAVQLRAIREGQDKLLQSHIALADQIGYSQGNPSAKNPLGIGNLAGQVAELAERLVVLQKELEFNSAATIKLAESLANVEVAFAVRLQAIENRLNEISPDFSGVTRENLEILREGIPITSEFAKKKRTNGKHPAGKRK